jgi:glycosyltransferase involved in cell wall biosynthesis
MPSIEGGGVEKNLFIITNFLSTKINKINVITTSYKFKKNFNKNVNVILPKNSFWNNCSRRIKYFICLAILIKFLINNKNSIVLSFQANLYCILICKLLSIKIIVRSNSAPEGWSKNIVKNILYKKIINLANQTIVNSYDFRRSMKKKFNVNCKVIYNPLNSKDIIEKSKNKIKFNFPNNVLKIINVGRLVDQKDQITILKSLNLIKKDIKFHLVILGKGVLKKKLLNFINSNDLKDNVSLIDYKKNPYPYIKKADLFLLSSKYEGLPNVLLEAILLKKFVISSNCPSGPKEILFNGKMGYLFSVSNYKDLSRKILLYYSNSRKKNQTFVKKAFKSLYRFDYKKNLNCYLGIVRQFLY